MTTELKDMNTIELMEYALTLEDDTLDINTKIAVERVLNIIKDRAEENVRLGLVTHGVFISSFLSSLFNLNIADSIAFQSHNCSISRLTFERNKKVTIQYLNFYGYLPENLRVPRPDLNIENG